MTAGCIRIMMLIKFDFIIQLKATLSQGLFEKTEVSDDLYRRRNGTKAGRACLHPALLRQRRVTSLCGAFLRRHSDVPGKRLRVAAGHPLHEKAGMSIKDIRQYIELSMQGDDTIDTRLEMFRHQREVLTQQIQQLQHTLETVEYKCWFYEAAKAAGTVDVPGAMTDADVPEQFRAIRQELRGQKMPNSER